MADFTVGIRDGYALTRDGHLINEEIIDDFEQGTLIGRYYFFSNEPNANATTDASFRGNYGLELDGQAELWSTPTDGNDLNYYFRDKETVEYWFRPRSLGTGQYRFLPCQQSNTTDDNRYQIEAIMSDGAFRIRKKSGGVTTLLDGGSVNTWSTSNWYQVLVRFQSEATDEHPRGIELQLRRYGGGSLSDPLVNVYVDDTELINDRNGIGFWSNGGHVWFDEVQTSFEGITY